MFGEGIKELLGQNQMIGSIECTSGQKEAYELLDKKDIDIILLDLNFDSNEFDGFTIAHYVKRTYPSIKVIVITQHAKIDHYNVLINEIGVDAYLDKRMSVNQLYIAIKEICNNKVYIDPMIKKVLDSGKWLKITPREKEIIELMCKGHSQKLIADRLFIDIKTVESHLRNARERYGFNNSAELISEYLSYKNSFRENYKGTTSPFRK